MEHGKNPLAVRRWSAVRDASAVETSGLRRSLAFWATTIFVYSGFRQQWQSTRLQPQASGQAQADYSPERRLGLDCPRQHRLCHNDEIHGPDLQAIDTEFAIGGQVVPLCLLRLWCHSHVYQAYHLSCRGSPNFHPSCAVSFSPYSVAMSLYISSASRRSEPLSLFGHTPRKKTFCFPYSTAEPQLNNSELLRFDTMADQLEISRLRTMGDLLPTDGYDYKGQTPKRLTTRMVRAWRNKHFAGLRFFVCVLCWLPP